LALVLPIFQEASKHFKNLHLDVFSSFGVDGWKDRDNQYQFLFDALRQTDNVTYHGHKDNKTVLEHLENSHIFLYPCVWKETSCISLIEAIRAGCLAIHPNYGALAETAASTTLLYDYSEDYNENANRCFNILYGVLEIEKNNNGWINKTANSEKFSLKNHDIELFKQKWKSLLMDIKK
jgi:glycosyltransferase involved in cell wall biosynthesis